MGSRCFSWMHPASENYHFFVGVETIWPLGRIVLSIRIQTNLIICSICWYRLPLIKNTIFWWNCHHLHFASFNRVIYRFSVEIKIFIRSLTWKLMLNLVDLSLRFFIAERIWKSEESSFLLGRAEHMLESENELVFIIHEIIYFCEDSTPFLLSVR